MILTPNAVLQLGKTPQQLLKASSEACTFASAMRRWFTDGHRQHDVCHVHRVREHVSSASRAIDKQKKVDDVPVPARVHVPQKRDRAENGSSFELFKHLPRVGQCCSTGDTGESRASRIFACLGTRASGVVDVLCVFCFSPMNEHGRGNGPTCGDHGKDGEQGGPHAGA